MLQDTKLKPEKELTRRAPVVVVLGHIDHGKTTLLDKIRQTNVAQKESGGITQHIGAYQIEVRIKNQESRKITFIDTPGHEAFSKMRSRGASVADLALLVIAADDGVRAQTEEAIQAIKAANLPFIVVLNKIDKDTADILRVKKELGDRGIILEEWGGKTPLVQVSAKTGENLEELLEIILLASELEELRYDLSLPASGVVIESHLEPRRGNAATLLLREGHIEKGDWILAGAAGIKIKILEDFGGKTLERAVASEPVRVIGFDELPQVGSSFQAFKTREEFDSRAQDIDISRPLLISKSSLEEGKKNIPLVIKTDAAGSLEAIFSELKKLEVPQLSLVILRSEVGDITEDDVRLASSGKDSIVVGFRVRIERSALIFAERFGIAIKNFDLIYELGDWLKAEILRRIPEEKERNILGRAKVWKIFKKDGSRQIVGGQVDSGGIFEGKNVVLSRRNFPLGEGRILELREGKIKVKQVLEGDEFGALVDLGFEVSPGDTLEIFEERAIKRG
jgi:translation initiation factor IF-2